MIHSFIDYLLSGKILQEKLLQIGNNKPYGQVIFINGGPGSGKSFVVKNFLDSAKFKIIDPDQIKKLYVELQKNRGNKEYTNFDWSDPVQTNKLHTTLSDKHMTRNYLGSILRGSIGNPEYLPNLIMDKTIKSTGELMELVFALKAFGYQLENMHMVWVLVDLSKAIQQNNSRDRRVDQNILIKSHRDIADTMLVYLNHQETLPLKGGLYLILNDRENVTYYDIEKGVIKDFKYLVLKYPGAPLMPANTFNDTISKLIVGRLPTQDQLAKFQV